MANFPIVNKSDHPYQRQLPTFYMEDYSIIGFRVSNCEQAVRVLNEHAFSMDLADGNTDVHIQEASQIHRVMQLLNDHGLECEIADVAEGMYQG